MLPANVAVIDTETTGMEPTDEVIEVGIVTSSMRFMSRESTYSATRPIPPEISAIHHLTDACVGGAPLFREVAPLLRDDLHRGGIDTLVAHNAEFDRKMLGEDFVDFNWICTYKCALHVWPDAPNHKNETLCYYLGVGTLGRAARGKCQAHSAWFDAAQTGAIFNELLKHASIEQMIQWTKDIKNLPKIPFGKHIGKKWAEIDSGYLSWLTKQGDMDTDIKQLATNELRRRR